MLPSELEKRSTSSDVVAMIVGTLGVLVAINVIAIIYLAAFPQNRGYRLVDAKWALTQELADEELPPQVLFVGDSSCNQGINSDLAADELELRTANLCTIGNMQLANSSWQLQYLLQHGATPSLVVITHVYDVWERDDVPLRRAAWAAGIPREVFRSAQPQPEWSIEDRILRAVGNLIPLYSYSESLRRVATAPQSMFDAASPLLLSPTGFQAAGAATPDRVRNDTRLHLKFLEEASPEVSPLNRASIEQIGEMAQTHGFDAVIVNAPIHDALADSSPFQTYHVDLMQQLDAIANESGIVLIDELYPFDAEMLQNSDHLSTDGAERYTREILDQLRAHGLVGTAR